VGWKRELELEEGELITSKNRIDAWGDEQTRCKNMNEI
jgi:hypothetical protein